MTENENNLSCRSFRIFAAFYFCLLLLPFYFLLSFSAFCLSASACSINPNLKIFLLNAERWFNVEIKLLSIANSFTPESSALPGSAPAKTPPSFNLGKIMADAGQFLPQAGQLFLQANEFTTFSCLLWNE